MAGPHLFRTYGCNSGYPSVVRGGVLGAAVIAAAVAVFAAGAHASDLGR